MRTQSDTAKYTHELDHVHPEHLPDFFFHWLKDAEYVSESQNRPVDEQGPTATPCQSCVEKRCLAEDKDPIKKLSVWAWDILSILLSSTPRQWEITASCESREKTTRQTAFSMQEVAESPAWRAAYPLPQLAGISSLAVLWGVHCLLDFYPMWHRENWNSGSLHYRSHMHPLGTWKKADPRVFSAGRPDSLWIWKSSYVLSCILGLAYIGFPTLKIRD